MNQNEVGIINATGLQPQNDRPLTRIGPGYDMSGCAGQHPGGDIKASFWRNDDQSGNVRALQEDVRAAPKHGDAGQGPKLLGYSAARTLAFAGGNNDGGDTGHQAVRLRGPQAWIDKALPVKVPNRTDMVLHVTRLDFFGGSTPRKTLRRPFSLPQGKTQGSIFCEPAYSEKPPEFKNIW
jgi:hypothetical protein